MVCRLLLQPSGSNQSSPRRLASVEKPGALDWEVDIGLRRKRGDKEVNRKQLLSWGL